MQNLVGASLPLDEADMRRLAELDCGFRYSIGYCPGFFDCPNAPWFGQSDAESLHRKLVRGASKAVWKFWYSP